MTAIFGVAPSPEAITAVAVHDAEAAGHRQHREAVDLLKLADALDRFRLPLARWWPDSNRMPGPVPAWAPPLAHDLVMLSEQARLDGATNNQALELALHTVLPE